MPVQSLGDALRVLADAVQTVDLRDRALLASGRLRNRRLLTLLAWAVLTAAGAVALLLATTGCGD